MVPERWRPVSWFAADADKDIIGEAEVQFAIAGRNRSSVSRITREFEFQPTWTEIGHGAHGMGPKLSD